MNLKFNIISLSLFCLLVLLQCGGKSTGPKYDSSIIGQWEWVVSSGGIGGWTTTPETENYELFYTFNTDSTYTKKTVDSFSIGILYGSFNINYERIWNENDSGYVIYLNENSGTNQPRTAYEVEYDTLYLSELCADCFTHKFVRLED